jgi:hypothetical protein
LAVGEDVVAYFAAQLAVSTKPWHRVLGLTLGEGLGNRAVFYRFRALVFAKLDAIYANVSTQRHLPLLEHIVVPWLRTRFRTPFVTSSDLNRACFVSSNNCFFAPLQFFEDEVVDVLRMFYEIREAASMARLIYHLSPAPRFRARTLSVIANMAPTPLLVFMKQCVLQNNSQKDPIRRMLQFVIAERARNETGAR